MSADYKSSGWTGEMLVWEAERLAAENLALRERIARQRKALGKLLLEATEKELSEAAQAFLEES